MVIKVNTIVYDGKEYLVADIPDVITGSESRLSMVPILLILHFMMM